MCGTISNWISSVADTATDVWHDVSAPVVDTTLGRIGANVATGGMAAPFLAAYDVSRGADPLKAAAGATLAYYGGQAGQDFFTGDASSIDPSTFGSWDVAGNTGMSVDPSSMGSWDVLPEMGTGASGVTPGAELLGTAGYSDMGTTYAGTSPASSFGQMGTGTYGMDTAPTGVEMVSQGGLNPTPTVGQGAELSYNPASNQTPGPMGLQDYLRMGNTALQDATGMGLARWGKGLHDMYRKNQSADLLKQQGNQARQQWQMNEDRINNYYAPGSPEAEAMRRMIERQDAAAGRRSQYGAREVDLAARMAAERSKYRTGMAPTQGQLLSGSMQLGQRSQGERSDMFSPLVSQWTLANLGI